MPIDTEGLFAVLSDKTRRQILTLLSQRKAVSYADIAKSLEISHTGKLNYHLKSLGDLIEKDQNGMYVLSGKGELAVQVMDRFRGYSNTASKFKSAVNWATLGAILFVLEPSIFALGIIFFGYSASSGGLELGTIHVDGLPGLVLGIALLYLPGLVLAWATKLKVIDPLNHFRVTASMRKWTISLSILSIFFGLFVGLFVMERVDGRVKYMLEDSMTP